MADYMRNFNRAVCVVDTCSIINLDEIVLAKKDVLFSIRMFFDVHIADEICDEFEQHRDLMTSRESSYWYRFLKSRRYTPTILTDNARTVGPFYTMPPSFTGSKDAGEHANTRVALELLTTGVVGHTIFVTDDESACNAFLKTVCCSFPGVILWTSVDVIMYLAALMFKERKVTFDEAKAAIKDVYASRRKWDAISEAEKSNIIKKQSRSIENLRLVKTVTDHWRV